MTDPTPEEQVTAADAAAAADHQPAMFIPPGPLPIKSDVSTIKVGEENAVMLTMSTPGGMNYYFMSADGAAILGRGLLKAGRSAQAETAAEEAAAERSKLYIPNGAGKIVTP